MKNKTTLPLLLLIAMTSSLFAQHTFNSKRKIENTSSTARKAARSKGPLSHPVLGATRTFNFSPVIPEHEVVYTRANTLPGFIQTKRDANFARAFVRKETTAGCYDYLRELQPILKISNAEDFIISSMRIDETNHQHVRMQQQYHGVPVYGAEIILHLNSSGEGEAFNGNYNNIIANLETKPTLTHEAAVNAARQALSRSSALKSLSALEKSIVQYAEPKSELCIYQPRGEQKASLVYHVIYCSSVHARWEYFIDAQNGNVIHHFNSTCYVDGPRTASATDLNSVSRSINTYQKGSTYYMLDTSRPMFSAANSMLPDAPAGGILTVDLSNTFGDNATVSHITSTTNTWSNAKGVSAHFNAGTAYEYYRTNHSRNSIDGNGGTIISIINTPDENGGPLDNAYWNGKAMFYGNGNVAFKPLAGAMDVAGHELTHGVVENTANLEYQGESGAINESMADVFGSMMDPADWNIGEDVVKAVFPTGALRSMEDPHNGGNSFNDLGYQPANTSEAYTGTDDNGGVHMNSGIPNHAFYLYATAITRDKAAAVYYKALSDYLTKSSQFVDLRLAVIKAAGDLYGTSSNEVTQAGAAFDAVGITTGQGGDYTNNIESNPGTEYMLIYNTDNTISNTLYRISIDGATQVALTTTTFLSKPSVTDDGSAAVFVADDKTIHVIVTTPQSDPQEFVLDERPIWSNAVVSKGGNRLAAITAVADQSIHIYDFTSSSWSTFELYNPTYSEDVEAEGPLYADALEWDYSGEYVVYDAFNRIKNSDGSDIEYWDVNFIHAWDKANHTKGTGKISKLFSSLPEGVSIGNPSFAKNSPYILAFDYVDETTNDYAILGMNIETNDVDGIAVNNTLGWPSYNKADSRVAFTIDNGSGNYETGYVQLNANKISSPGNITYLYDKSMWPVYFAAGTRTIGDASEVTGIEQPETELPLAVYPNPFDNEIKIKLDKPLSAQGRIEMMNNLGQRISDLVIEKSPDFIRIKTGSLTPGAYIVRVRDGRHVAVNKVVKIH